MATYRGSCHCGRVTFEARTDPLTRSVVCNCSLCRRRGAVMATIADPETDFQLLTGEDAIGEYRFHTRTARHYFCRYCGIYTHHRPRSDPSMLRVNAACLEGVDPSALEPALVDGRSMD